MKYLLDTANLDEIRELSEYLPIAGVTSNPTIVKREGAVPFFAHMREIRTIIGSLRPLHIQVTARNYDGMMRDAEAVFRHVDEKVFIKVPVDFAGVKVIKALKRQGANVTATAAASPASSATTATKRRFWRRASNSLLRSTAPSSQARTPSLSVRIFCARFLLRRL